MLQACPSVSFQEVCDLDPETTLVLTVNNRYARRIVDRLVASLGAQRAVIAIPDIIPLGAWLARMADDLSFHADRPMPSWMADNFGTMYLWQQVIEETEPGRSLLDIGQAARLACEADRMLDEWRIRVEPHEETPDYRRFMVWRERYRLLLQERDLEDSNLAIERVLSAVSEGVLQTSARHIVLAGFNDVSRRLSDLLGALQTRGVTVRALDEPVTPAGDVRSVRAPDPHSEWVLAAQWALRQLQQDPQGRYAIVVPGLEGNVPLAHRVLRDALAPEHVFNIAVGRPLSEWPLVRAALAWLRVVARFARGQVCSAQELGAALLAGGCTAHEEEASRRAALDARLRHNAVPGMNADQFAAALDDYVPRLATAWRQAMERAETFASRADTSDWVGPIRELLQALGFPGQTALDSHAWQTLESFDQRIETLAVLTPVTGPVSFGKAVAMLAQMARETVFQPQRDPRARLDVLGFLESEGGHWDGVWVLGLTDDVLPAVPRPNPLIPLAALRRVNAPRATPEREFHWAQTLFTGLLGSAARVWLSHAAREGERELRASPFLAAFPVHDFEPEAPSCPALPLEFVVDEQGPPVMQGEPVRGGIALLDAQARNPLWAFVRFRLGASELPDYADMANQNVRGIFLHKVMELFWKLTPDMAALERLATDKRLHALVDEVIGRAADEILTDFSPAMRTLEMQRAHAVVMRWLELERRREPFHVVAVEQRDRWSHAGVELSIRLDRVDRLPDGRLVVIDYKSGSGLANLARSWTRPRPVDLQLPFYAAVLGGRDPGVAALVQATLHSGRVDTVGVSDGDCGFDGVDHFSSWEGLAASRWDDVLTGWQTAIEDMVTEFAQGRAPNRIADVNDLQYCDVLPFLRLNEEYPGDDETAQ